MKKIKKNREREYRGSLIKQFLFSRTKRRNRCGKDGIDRIIQRVEGVEKTLHVMAREMARKSRECSKTLNLTPDDK